jgi:Trypsin
MMMTKRRWIRLATAAAATALTLAFSASPAGAVVGGTTDTTNKYANVGALQANTSQGWVVFCSGTLVAPDIVLTAAHCVDFFTADVGQPGLGVDDLRVTFELTAGDDSVAYAAESIAIHPGWLEWLETVDAKGNSKHLFLAPPAQDIALIFLEEDVEGIAPAPIADAGYLDELDLTSETFTVVGYGTDEFVTGSAASPQAVTIFDSTRSYRDVTAITEHDAFPDRFVKVTAGVCFGDSGGPMFHGDTVVALNTWTFSYRCSGPNLEYRVDSAPAQEFLAQYGL